MNRDQVTRRDFPAEQDGYDRASVDAHLVAVEALIAAAEAEVAALRIEGAALRRTAPAAESAARSESAESTGKQSDPAGEPGGPAAEAGSLPRTEPSAATDSPASAGGNDDEVSARLVATKLAMDGADRDAIRERLQCDYELEDADGLIDDLFERLG